MSALEIAALVLFGIMALIGCIRLDRRGGMYNAVVAESTQLSTVSSARQPVLSGDVPMFSEGLARRANLPAYYSGRLTDLHVA